MPCGTHFSTFHQRVVFMRKRAAVCRRFWRDWSDWRRLSDEDARVRMERAWRDIVGSMQLAGLVSRKTFWQDVRVPKVVVEVVGERLWRKKWTQETLPRRLEP